MPSAESAERDIAAASAAWMAAFNRCDAASAAALYDADAVLWGTTAAAIIATPAGIRQYFERVCSASPPPTVVWGEQLIRVYGDTAINSGSYTFSLVLQGEARVLPARYSFAYRRRAGEWLIVDHHSSVVPATVR